MSMSWHNFIFGAFDPAGTITVDKLPGALWIQALSVRAFGLHTWAIILPQVIEGILTVLVLYRAVTRLAGPTADLIAALVLAVSPATVALDRENISDSLLILLLVLAANAVSGAIAGLTADDAGQDATLAASDPDGPSSGAADGDHLVAGERAAPAGRDADAGDFGQARGVARVRQPREPWADPRLRWITTHCTQISKRFYDCVPADAG